MSEPETTTEVITTTTQHTSDDTEDSYDNSLMPGSSGAELPTDDETGKWFTSVDIVLLQFIFEIL